MQSHEDRAFSAGNQLELWTAPDAPPMLGLRVLRRDGREAAFDLAALSDSIRRAAWPGETLDGDTALSLARAVRLFLQQTPQPVSIETVRETVERVLLEMGYTLTARMYAGAFAPTADTAPNARMAGMFDEALPLDRAERFLAATAADADLKRSEAETVLAHLLAQIRASGIEGLTPGLLREWLRSELQARGLSTHAAKIARLTLPVSALHDAFTENDRPPANAPGDPESAALALAGRVSAAYVLGQLMPSSVGQAHLRGDIQVRGIGQFLRLDSALLDVEDLKAHGPIAGGPLSASPDMLVAQLASQSDFLSKFFGGQVSWTAINFGFAPLLQDQTDADLRTLARALFFGSNATHGAVAPRAVTEYRLAWDTPESAPAEIADGHGEHVPAEATYASARRFFIEALETLAEISEQGWPLPAANVAIHLSPYFFGAPEADRLLALLGRIAAGALPIALHYDCASPRLFDVLASAELPVVAQTVNISVARAARASTDMEDFMARMESRLEQAVAAHRVKREFLDQIYAGRSGPMAALRRRFNEGPLGTPSRMQYRIALEDAGVAAFERAGISWIAPGDESVAIETALTHLRESCARWSNATGLLLTLADANGLRPQSRAQTGAAPRHSARPADIVAIESRLHSLYDDAPYFAVNGESFATPREAADFIRHAFLHTPCRALRIL